jgi:hypothetical protein
MPQLQKYLYRIYCKTCQDFTLHENLQDLKLSQKEPEFNISHTNEPVYRCECGKVYETVAIKDIDEYKVLKQRERYNKSKEKEFNTYLSYLNPTTHNNMLTDLLRSDFGNETIIIESDAGLEEIKKREREERTRHKNSLKDLIDKHKNDERNLPCSCGSGVKYKKCCYNLVSNAQNQLLNL